MANAKLDAYRQEHMLGFLGEADFVNSDTTSGRVGCTECLGFGPRFKGRAVPPDRV